MLKFSVIPLKPEESEKNTEGGLVGNITFIKIY
jgi:hypothetical protein